MCPLCGHTPHPACSYPVCARPGCGRPACQHSHLNQHPLYDSQTSCEGYMPEEGVPFGEWQPGGGSSGGGGASGSW